MEASIPNKGFRKREQAIFEDPKYEYSTDDELLDDEILTHQ